MRPAGRTIRASSVKRGGRLAKLRSANPQVTPSAAPSGEGKVQGVTVHEWGVGAGRGEHPVRQVDADRPQTACAQLAAEVTGAARQVEHGRAATELE